ncbi:hypothetical protein QQG55_14475 [Brugia pahangi]
MLCQEYEHELILGQMIFIAIGVRDFCAKRTANAVCRKRQILEAVAEKTRKLREDSHRRVKQRKIQLEKEGEEKRKESSIKIKQQAIKTISNRGRKVHDLPGTPVAKRTRNALGLMPIDKRFCCRGTVMENFLNYATICKTEEKSISD